ncbi:enoyl-CoA hydratase/isomerase family protein [Streptomyces sp. WMMC500]|uniref:enoyl-CoA hydratase/isomerase family protein n=1 Tax=Streptomyces sp. WMMC500 TaxID=3015154 RepID=UPI00248B6970|nr:enoyl-CoA hydratase/isomerase family protein [Streptomyces sp. WMMC500]WBB61233.1 enoyl-CoA hydratase/isomerase family protein [Streptomyces sp. WMMC500]
MSIAPRGTDVRYDVDGAVARIAFARTGRANALDLAAAHTLAAAVRRAATDECRAVVLTGDGERFCAGGDVRSMAEAADRSGYVRELAAVLGDALGALRALPAPVVAGVHGAVAGAGLAVMLSADVVVAERSTKFVSAYAGMGLTPDCGVSFLLPQAVGRQRALELALTGRVLTAPEARDWGLVAAVVDEGSAGARAEEIAQGMVAQPPFALAEAKRMIRASGGRPPAAGLRDEVDTIAEAVGSAEATALIDRFTGGAAVRR